MKTTKELIVALEDQDHVHTLCIPAEKVRAFFSEADGGDLGEEFDQMLDEAQGAVFSEETDEAYVLIKVTSIK